MKIKNTLWIVSTDTKAENSVTCVDAPSEESALRTGALLWSVKPEQLRATQTRLYRGAKIPFQSSVSPEDIERMKALNDKKELQQAVAKLADEVLALHKAFQEEKKGRGLVVKTIKLTPAQKKALTTDLKKF